jgi:hypothetical protein
MVTDDAEARRLFGDCGHVEACYMRRRIPTATARLEILA